MELVTGSMDDEKLKSIIKYGSGTQSPGLYLSSKLKSENVPEMKFQVACFLSALLSFSCSDSTGPTKRTENITNNKRPIKKPPANFSDTININFPSSVFYSPDSIQLDQIKAASDAKIFDGTMHEYYYLVRNAHSVIKKHFPQLKIVDAKNVRYLLFTDVNNAKNIIDLDTKNDAYGLFVFDRKKQPQLVDMANVESELGFYLAK
jgi:hypothetical protein